MIIGSGLIAREFLKKESDFMDCLVFASGVSNSKNIDESEYEREFLKLKEYLKINKKLIYFSSIHVLDPSHKNDFYVKFKIKMERYIKDNVSNYIIYRLPIVMGKGGYEKSLFNFLYKCISHKEKMNISVNSYRYIVDVENMCVLVYETLHLNNETINLVFNKSYNIINIVKAYETALGVSAIYEKNSGGKYFEVDNSAFIKSIPKDYNLESFITQDYLVSIIKKYYG